MESFNGFRRNAIVIASGLITAFITLNYPTTKYLTHNLN